MNDCGTGSRRGPIWAHPTSYSEAAEEGGVLAVGEAVAEEIASALDQLTLV
jgi:hypothetical protein